MEFIGSRGGIWTKLAYFIDNINKATIAIDFGRKGFATNGEAEEGDL
ncbi:MAG: hypothetical protein LBU83_02590 [Bacteroidales bacterium]|nr:hypothetical protein [Bacteroidales bacterium]